MILVFVLISVILAILTILYNTVKKAPVRFEDEEAFIEAVEYEDRFPLVTDLKQEFSCAMSQNEFISHEKEFDSHVLENVR